jgi:hypothetical protein
MALTRTFKCSPQDLSRILEEVKSLGASVEGDARSGRLVGDTLMGHFEGTYEHDGESLTLAITKKPALIPESFLAGRLDEMARKYGGG